MSKYKLVDIFESFKDELSPEEKERFDRLSKDDKDKLEKIKMMMYKLKKVDENMVADEDVAKEIKRLEDENPKGFAKEISRLKVRQAAIDMMKKAKSKGEVSENEEAVDLAIETSQEKAGIAEVSSSEGSRIEGLLNIPMKAKFLEAFEELYLDLVEEDPFYAEDVVDHLGIEMLKHLDGIQAQGDKLAGIAEEDEVKSNDEMSDDERENFYLNLDSVEEGYEDTKGKALYPILKAGANATGDEIEMYVKSLAKDIELNGKEQYKDFTSDDYVEDFKNYIADKGLEEMGDATVASAANGLENIIDSLKKLSKAAGPVAKKAYAALQVLGAGAGAAIRNEEEDLEENDRLKEHFSRFLKDYQ